MTTLVVGIGFSSRAEALDIATLVERVLAGRIAQALALPDTLARHDAARDAAAMLALPLAPVDDAAIEAAQPRCLTRPCRAARAVAEGAALAAAGPNATLVVPRQKAARVTCALAAAPA